jgi:hypothetical protein
MPNITKKALIKKEVSFLNIFPCKGGFSDSISPRSLIIGMLVDFNIHCRIKFRSYCEVFNAPMPSNDVTTQCTPLQIIKERHRRISGNWKPCTSSWEYIRTALYFLYLSSLGHEVLGKINTKKCRSSTISTTGANALHPKDNIQGGYHFMSLSTGKLLTRHQWTALPMPDQVIRRVEALAMSPPRISPLPLPNNSFSDVATRVSSLPPTFAILLVILLTQIQMLKERMIMKTPLTTIVTTAIIVMHHQATNQATLTTTV